MCGPCCHVLAAVRLAPNSFCCFFQRWSRNARIGAGQLDPGGEAGEGGGRLRSRAACRAGSSEVTWNHVPSYYAVGTAWWRCARHLAGAT